jgi:hypothetical protein
MAKKEKPSERRVIMAKSLARQWLRKQATEEYRLKVYFGAIEIRNLPGLLRSLRDAKIRMAGVEPITDMGIEEGFDSITLWSGNRTSLINLKDWFEKRGFETTGIW